ncbi:MAG: lipoyl(octanoyl) transferase LipB [Alphaproteobacteria bacterium]|nr:MAG: lipoyl(octanoyl) transferase LipB [Alphaproteobacteria bacterium]
MTPTRLQITTIASPPGEENTLWCRSAQPVSYDAALEAMDSVVAAIRAQTGPEMVWLLEHPALYTAGTGAKREDLRQPDRLPIHTTGRGGKWTYHGPGQRVAYVMLDLRARGIDPRDYVRRLETWLITALGLLGVQGERREDRIGIWVQTPRSELKIAALGVRIRHGVTLHGISLNISPNLDDFRGIVPCGLDEYGVTSLADLGLPCTMDQADAALGQAWATAFGASREGSA